MPLPVNVTTVTVLGTFLTPEGNPSTGTITFTPSSWLTNSGANVAIPNSPTTKTLGTAGNFSVLLPITDDPDLSPDNWVYNVSEVVDGVSQNYNILLPGTVAVGGTVFLADLVPAAPAGPEYYSLASSLAIGTVTTVATGGSATATITGLAPSQVLNLGIPTGATGTVASAGSGSVGTAAVAPTGDPDTGIYFPAANQVGITTGGSAAAIFAAGAISNPTFTGVASFPDGSASAPSITNTGDTNTGIAFPADDTLAISTGGTERVRVGSTGKIIVNNGTEAYEVYRDTSTGLLFLDGTQSSGFNGFVFRTRPSGGSTVERVRVATDGTLFIGNGVTNAAPANGIISATGGSGSNVAGAALALFAGAGTGTGAGGYVGAFTAAAGASGSSLNAHTERMRIDSNGLITGTGTSLGAWTAYTPSLTASTTNPTLGTGSTASGAYMQIGKMVRVYLRIVFGTSGTNAGSGTYSISLPVTSKATGFAEPLGSGEVRDSSANILRMVSVFRGSTSTLQLKHVSATNGELLSLTHSAPWAWDASDEIFLQFSYEAA
jgi:hypothetical protein